MERTLFDEHALAYAHLRADVTQRLIRYLESDTAASVMAEQFPLPEKMPGLHGFMRELAQCYAAMLRSWVRNAYAK